MKRLHLLLFALLMGITASSHPWKPAHYIIIDTDGGIDDIRSISMLLASPDVRVLGIIASSGVIKADEAYIKVKSLLNSYYHEGVPVGINSSYTFDSQYKSLASEIKWGDESSAEPTNAPDFIYLIKNILSYEKTPVSFICLGSMGTAYAAASQIPEFNKQVKEIIWSSEGVTNNKDHNYLINKKSADNILSGNIPVRIVKGTGEKIFYDGGLINKIQLINTPYAKKTGDFFNSDKIRDHSFAFTANDEMVALYLHYPGLFENNSANEFSAPEVNMTAIKESLLKILRRETVPPNQVIKILPVDPSFYFEDINPSVTEIINRYGTDEWTSGVIANELHRHLGVFAIVGVKMGIRARQYFNTGVDEFQATSFAGSTPPLSCMNDGIQVSTGATPGHGLLTVSRDSLTKPAAEFTYMDHKIRLTLKPELARKISNELKEINFIYGLDSNIYWELVRKNSIKYWLELDRNEIFDIEVLE